MGRKTIPANPNSANPRLKFSQDVDVVLGSDIENLYTVSEKPLPDIIDKSWTDQATQKLYTITWVSNFQLLKKDGSKVDKLDNGKSYAIELDKQGEKLFYWDGSAVVPLDYSLIQNTNRARAIIFRGDPPVGWGS